MRRAVHGVTLIELMVATAIGLVAIVGALGVLQVQSAALGKQLGGSQARDQGTAALGVLEKAVRTAGLGVDPQMAFDFDSYACKLPGGPLNTSESTNCSALKRDAVDAPDELVVAYRDPLYSTNAAPSPGYTGCPSGATNFIGKAWSVRSATASSVTLAMKPGDVIYRGQNLQIACDDGITYLYATVSSAKTSVAATSTACSDTTLQLYSTQANDLFNQPSGLSTACFGTGNARAFAVRRERYFLRRDTSVNPPRSFLMLDQGLDRNDDGALTDADLLPVAADIEDMQIAYGLDQVGILALPTAPTGWLTATYVTDNNNNGVWGDNPFSSNVEQLSAILNSGTTALAQFTAANSALGYGPGQKCTGSSSIAQYQYPCILGTAPVEVSPSNSIHAYRWTAWPGNIAHVQIGLIARAAVSELPSQVTQDENILPTLGNRPQQTSTFSTWYSAIKPAGHKRVVLRTAVRPVNMALQAMFWN